MSAPITGPPPPYEATSSSATASSNQNATSEAATDQSSTRPKTRNGIPPQTRRSMEDEQRTLPQGWIRQYDSKEHHQFFVDTTKNPPRSIWQHPYDDETYVNSLSPEERAKIRGLHRVPTDADIAAESSDDDDYHQRPMPPKNAELPPRPQHQAEQLSSIHRLGRRMKDKVTSTTHEQRELMRAQRAEEERRIYERHKMYRQAMARAIQTGEPQFIGKDRSGKDVYVEPPMGGYPGVGNGYGHSPYSSGPYARPNAMYLRPQQPYYRPYYGGYGGGLGLPLGAGILGGALLGSAMF